MSNISTFQSVTKIRKFFKVLATNLIHASIPMFLLLTFSLVLLLPSQSKEIFRILTYIGNTQSNVSHITQFLWLINTLSWWSFMQWNWSRFRMNVKNPNWRNGGEDKLSNFLIAWMPRLLGALPFLIVGFGFTLYGIEYKQGFQIKNFFSYVCILLFFISFIIYTFRVRINQSKILNGILFRVCCLILAIMPAGLLLFNILSILSKSIENSVIISSIFTIILFIISWFLKPNLTLFHTWFSRYGSSEWSNATTGYESLDVLFKILKTSPINAFFILFQVLIFSIGISVAVGSFPIEFGNMMGAAAIIALAFAAALPILSLIAVFGRHFLGFPLWSSLIVLFILSAFVQNSLHLILPQDIYISKIRYSVRYIKEDSLDENTRKQKRITLENLINQWERQHKSPNTADRKITPIVFISSSGGGQKAAFWTSRVLGELDKKILGFNKHILGISAVSGGALGSTVYVSLLTTEIEKEAIADKAEKIIDQDGISPTAAALLFSDIPSNVLPFSFSPDRATILEEVWERAWRNENYNYDQTFCNTQNIFSDNFLCLQAGLNKEENIWIPALFLNGTIQEKGQRVIMSNILLEQNWDAEDFFKLSAKRIKTSTAVMNSARFPYVSPAGIISPKNQNNEGQKLRIIDGGYIDNSGTLTLKEFSQSALKILDRNQPDNNNKYVPVFIEIENDLRRQEKKIAHLPLLNFEFIHQIFGPAIGFYKTYSARGATASTQLHHSVKDAQYCINTLGIQDVVCLPKGRFEKPIYLKFSLCGNSKQENVLGWAHSKLTLDIFKNSFSNHTDCAKKNMDNIEKLESKFQ